VTTIPTAEVVPTPPGSRGLTRKDRVPQARGVARRDEAADEPGV